MGHYSRQTDVFALILEITCLYLILVSTDVDPVLFVMKYTVEVVPLHIVRIVIM